MAKPQYLHQLFDAHLADLKTIIPNVDNIFICPICLHRFKREAIDNKVLRDGHVWPKDIRAASKSEAIKEQRVLLCDYCNTKAGGHGDAQMGILERVKQGEKSGCLYAERTIEILLAPNEPPIKLNATVTRISDTNFKLNFEKRKDSQLWARNNPEEQQKFKSIKNDDNPVTIIIHSTHELKSGFAEVGWINSAYLFAFYRFGYRYIFHEALNSIRRYILGSFNADKNNPPQLSRSEMLDVHTCDTHYEKEPKLSVAIPLDGTLPLYLFISLLDYHVKLPFHFDKDVLENLISAQILEQGIDLDALANLETPLHVEVVCTKRNVHTCTWDFVLGRPLSEEDVGEG